MVLKIDFDDDDYVYQTDTIKDKMNITKEAIKKNEYLIVHIIICRDISMD